MVLIAVIKQCMLTGSTVCTDIGEYFSFGQLWFRSFSKCQVLIGWSHIPRSELTVDHIAAVDMPCHWSESQELLIRWSLWIYGFLSRWHPYPGWEVRQSLSNSVSTRYDLPFSEHRHLEALYASAISLSYLLLAYIQCSVVYEALYPKHMACTSWSTLPPCMQHQQ